MRCARRCPRAYGIGALLRADRRGGRRRRGGERSAPATLGQADVAVGGDDDVVENSDSAEIADLAQPEGELDVGTRRCWVSGRVVVDEDDRRGRGSDERSEHVARVNLDAGQATSTEELVEEDPM